MWIFRWVLLLLIVFFLVGFFSQNADPKVHVSFLGWKSPIFPLSFMLFLAALAGYILSLIVAIINQIRLRSQISKMRRENRELQLELDRLRNFALEDEQPALNTGRQISMTFAEFLLLLMVLLGAVGAAFYYVERGRRRNITPVSPYTEGLLGILEGDTAKALQKLRDAVSDDTSNIDAYIRLGRLYADTGDMERAIKIHRSLTLRGDLVGKQRLDVYRALAEDYLKINDPGRALEAVGHILALSKKDAWALRKKSELLMSQENWAGAFDEAVKLNGTSESFLPRRLAVLKVLEGLRLCGSGKERDGRIEFREAIKYEPTLVAPFLYWGDSYIRENRTEDAVKIWRRLLEVNPAHSYVVFDRLESHLFDLGRFSEIEQIYRSVIRNFRQNVHAYAALSKFLAKRGDVGEAVGVLRDGLEHNPDSLWLRRRLIRMYHDMHDSEHAQQISREILSRVIKEVYDYTCSNCGHVSHEPLWQCPSCKQLDTFNV